MSDDVTPDTKNAILRALDEGTLDPDDTLSSTEVTALRQWCSPTSYTYRLVIDVELLAHREPTLDHLGRCVEHMAKGLTESDAYPNLGGDEWPDTEVTVLTTAVLPGLPDDDPLP